MTRPEPLPDTWYGRRLLVLRELARSLEAAEATDIDSISEALDTDTGVAVSDGRRFLEAGYKPRSTGRAPSSASRA